MNRCFRIVCGVLLLSLAISAYGQFTPAQPGGQPAAGVCPAPACPCPCPPTDEDRWQNALTIYLWVPAVTGDIRVRGNDAHISSSIADTWDSLSDLTNAFTAHYEGGPHQWTLIADYLHLRYKNDSTVNSQAVTIRPSQTIAELAGAYTVQAQYDDMGLGSKVQVLAGVRYTSLGIALESAAPTLNVNGSRNWYAIFVGARYIQQVAPKFAYSLRADAGGFNMGANTNFTFNAIVNLRYNLARQWAVDGGWRWLDYNYNQGSGTDQFVYNVLSNGPYLGITYLF